VFKCLTINVLWLYEIYFIFFGHGGYLSYTSGIYRYITQIVFIHTPVYSKKTFLFKKVFLFYISFFWQTKKPGTYRPGFLTLASTYLTKTHIHFSR
jgi:hypothetical protein